MVRWEPGARERLREAALDLYETRGFEETTVTDIAASAGLTERTFFRYFADKREVFFAGQEAFQQAFLEGIAAVPEGSTPFEIIEAAVLSAAAFFPDDRRSHSRQRQVVIDATPELQERELLKMAALAAVIGGALRARGIAEPVATLAAESGVTVFRVSFDQWIAAGSTRSLVDIERGIFEELGLLTRH